MRKKYDFIIIGASKAGLTAAQTIREHCPGDSILIVNEEDRLPYKRTQLSKKLASGFEKEDFALYQDDWYAERNLDLINNTKALEIDPDNHLLILSNHESPGWDKILVATGAEPGEAEIPGISNAFTLRYISDAEILRVKLQNSRRVIILGQGVEGVELAEQSQKMGCEVTITGGDSRLIHKWLDNLLSERLLKLFEKQGIACRFNRKVEEIRMREDESGPAFSLYSSDETLNGDLILASTGVIPRMELTSSLGINSKYGIRTDNYYETECPGIYAAGDVLEIPSDWTRGLWHTAEFQGEAAGLNMAGIPTLREDKPARLKCEVFGDYFFSMNYNRVLESDTIHGWQEGHHLDSEGQYLKLFVRNGRTVAGIMAGMKQISKVLEEGIRNGMDPDALIKNIESGK